MTTAESLDFDVDVNDQGGLKRELVFAIPATVVDQTVSEMCDQVGQSVRLPGFRNGKVPRKVIRGRFTEQINAQVMEKLVPEYYRKAVEKSGIAAITDPVFAPIQVTDGEAMNVTVTVEVQPEIDLAPYDGLELEAVDVTVTDEDLKVAHKSLQDSMASVEPAPEDHVAANGDVAVIDFLGKLNGEPFDGGKGENYSLNLGDGRFIPGFEEQIVGHKAGESFDVTVTFPEEYHNDELKGQEAVFEVTLHSLKNKVLPEVDDEFASQVGDFDTLEALNETLREQILDKRNNEQREHHRAILFAKLAEDNVYDPPEQWVESELDDAVETQRRMRTMRGENAHLATAEEEEAERQSLREAAIIEARGRGVVAEIAKREDLKVSEDEFSAEIVRIAQQHGRSPDEIAQTFKQHPAEIARLNDHLLRGKALDLVIDRAHITTVDRAEDGA